MTASDLNQRFSEKDKWPTFLNIEQPSTSVETSVDENSYEIVCEIPASLSWFKGHFPDQPVLPGVVQVNWANDLAQQLFSIKDFRGINSLKFNTMVLPETQVTLSLIFNPERHSVKFSYNSNGTLFSSGILIFSGT